MIYLIWSLVNLGALVWFIYISFSVFKLIREHLGMPALIIFILGSLSFVKENVTSEKPQTFLNDQMVPGMQVINEELFYGITLSYAYPKDSLTGEVLGDVFQSGLVIGHQWKPIPPVFQFKDGKWHYSVIGTHEWKLLGLTLYSEPQRFTGQIK